MQDLIEWLEQYEIYYNKELIIKLKQLTFKEKEQIIDAYENGVGDENERNLSGQFTNAKEYYNKTYNQNK